MKSESPEAWLKEHDIPDGTELLSNLQKKSTLIQTENQDQTILNNSPQPQVDSVIQIVNNSPQPQVDSVNNSPQPQVNSVNNSPQPQVNDKILTTDPSPTEKKSVLNSSEISNGHKSCKEYDYSKVQIQKLERSQNSTKQAEFTISSPQSKDVPSQNKCELDPISTEKKQEEEKGVRLHLTPVSKDIGRWGEEFVFNFLKQHYRSKYPECTFTETELGFTLTKSPDELKLKVNWMNRTKESNEPYDITITENESEITIEVKATLREENTEFSMSHKEYDLMKKLQDKYQLILVLGAGKANPRLFKIENPAKFLENGDLKITSYTLQF